MQTSHNPLQPARVRKTIRREFMHNGKLAVEIQRVWAEPTDSLPVQTKPTTGKATTAETATKKATTDKTATKKATTEKTATDKTATGNKATSPADPVSQKPASEPTLVDLTEHKDTQQTENELESWEQVDWEDTEPMCKEAVEGDFTMVEH